MPTQQACSSGRASAGISGSRFLVLNDEVDENLGEGLGHRAPAYALSGLGVHGGRVDPGRCPGLMDGRAFGAAYRAFVS